MNKIKEWFLNFNESKQKCLLLHGTPGIGKTCIAKILLKHYDYDPIEFNASEVRNQKLINNKLNEIINKRNILKMMSSQKKYMGIIMDEIDGISGGERSGLSEIINIINPKKSKNNKTPIICISNSVVEKKMQEIMKHSLSIKINKPNKMQLSKVLENIITNENMVLEQPIKEMIIKRSQNDYRRLINLLELINQNYKFCNNIELIIDNFENKQININSYQATDEIINKYTNIKNILNLFENDKNFISMLLYENFISDIVYNKKSQNDKKIETLCEVYNNFSIGDLYDHNIHINHYWELYDYNCIVKGSISSFLINNMDKYSYKKKTKLDFSKLLNKTELEYLNYKNLDEIYKKFNFYNNSNTHTYLCDYLLFSLSYDKSQDNAISIFKTYGYQLKDIDKLIKNSSNISHYKDFFSKKYKSQLLKKL